MSNLSSVASERLAKKAKAAESAQQHINSADTAQVAGASEELQRLNVDIPKRLHRALKQRAVNDDTNIREQVIAALAAHLNE